MAEREQVSLKAQSFFNDLWARGDPWELETSNWEHESPDIGAYLKSAAAPAHSRGVWLGKPMRCWLWMSRLRLLRGRS